ncbi:MAG TPA: hypothetical protein VN948_05745 [Terriglobales bacterium]|nr:hypothetical protein [Terriglobales bacterium]
MTLFQRWKQTALHNKALVLTGCIVAVGTLFGTGAAIFQVYITRENNRTTTEKIDKLIQAANLQASAAAQNAAAAANFATSADGINAQTKLAVDKFERMAKASENSISTIQITAKSALDASIEASRLDQRAWVGIETFGMDATSHKIVVVFKNTGKTPAIHVALSWLEVGSVADSDYTHTPELHPELHNGVFADYDEWLEYWNHERRKRGKENWPESANERSIFGDEVIAPGATSSRTYSLGIQQFLLGKLTYNDLFSHTTRNTKFCLIPWNKEQVAMCSGGSGMD